MASEERNRLLARQVAAYEWQNSILLLTIREQDIPPENRDLLRWMKAQMFTSAAVPTNSPTVSDNSSIDLEEDLLLSDDQ